MKLQLSRGEAFLVVQYGERITTRSVPGGEQPVRHRTTTIRIEFVVLGTSTKLSIEETVSCSHLDQFTRRDGRREAMRKLFKTDGPCDTGNGFLNHKDRAAIAAILLPPRSR